MTSFLLILFLSVLISVIIGVIKNNKFWLILGNTALTALVAGSAAFLAVTAVSFIPQGKYIDGTKVLLVSVDTIQGVSGSFLGFSSDREFKYYYKEEDTKFVKYDTVPKDHSFITEDEIENPYFTEMIWVYDFEPFNNLLWGGMHNTMWSFHVPPGTLSKLFEMN